MNGKDLRIGNFISVLGNTVEVIKILGEKKIEIHSDILQFCDVDIKDEDEDVKPIPLTEKWLLKFGFKQVFESSFENISLSYWVHNCICCFYNETDKDNFLLGHGYSDFNGKYHVTTAYWTKEVHTLQNYYKANIGKELTIK